MSDSSKYLNVINNISFFLIKHVYIFSTYFSTDQQIVSNVRTPFGFPSATLRLRQRVLAEDMLWLWRTRWSEILSDSFTELANRSTKDHYKKYVHIFLSFLVPSLIQHR